MWRLCQLPLLNAPNSKPKHRYTALRMTMDVFAECLTPFQTCTRPCPMRFQSLHHACTGHMKLPTKHMPPALPSIALPSICRPLCYAHVQVCRALRHICRSMAAVFGHTQTAEINASHAQDSRDGCQACSPSMLPSCCCAKAGLAEQSLQARL